MIRFLLLSSLFCLSFHVNAQLKNIEKSGAPAVKIDPPKNIKPTSEISDKQRFIYQNIGGLEVAKIHKPIQVKQVDWNKMPILIRGSLATPYADITRQSLEYLSSIASYFDIQDPAKEWEITEIIKDELGMQHIKVQQLYKDVAVFAGELNLHAKNGKIETAMGRGFPTPELSNIVPQITLEQAERRVWEHLKTKKHFVAFSQKQKQLFRLEQVQLSLVIYHEKQHAQKERLAYHVHAYENLASLKTFFMDANTGEVFYEFENICNLHSDPPPPDGPQTANAQDLNGQNRTIDVYEVGGNFYMINATKPNFSFSQSDMPHGPVGVIWTLDAQHSSPQSDNFTTFHVANNDNISWLDKSSVSAHHNAAIAYDYFKDVHGRNAIDGSGGNIISVVNVTDEDDLDMDNAFWNGVGMFYGNGNSAFKPLAGAVDVAGHEMSHGVVQSSANLQYENESGALNESFADIFGAMMDRDDYQIGEDVVTNVFPSGALRDLSNPNNGGSQLGQPGYQPAHVNEQYLGNEDNGGVHINSGIPNFAFFKLAEAVGKDKAEKIYYRALTQYLTRSSRFIDARNAVVQAADDLFGASEVQAAKNAFDEVGIGEGAGGDYTNDAETNPGDEFLVYSDADQTKLIIVNSSLEEVYNPASVFAPISKPSVSDDGSLIYYVNSDNQIALTIINWDTGQANGEIIQDQNIWSNVVISKDGNRMAAVETAQSNRIHIYDFNLGEWYTDALGEFGFELYNPTFTEGVSTGDAKFADAMEFDISGEILMYDVYSEIDGDFGEKIGYWDIGFLEIFDNSKADWGSGRISKMFSNLAEDVSVGNPTFAKNSPYIIAFDLIDGNEYSLIAANVETGDLGLVFENTSLSYPSYTATDEQILFTSESTFDLDIFEINLETDKITSIDNSEGLIIEDALWGTAFRNGSRVLSGIEDIELGKAVLKIYPNPAINDLFYEFESKNGGSAVLEIRSLDGRMILSEKQLLVRGLNRNALSISAYPSGNYSITLKYNGQQRTAQITKL